MCSPPLASDRSSSSFAGGDPLAPDLSSSPLASGGPFAPLSPPLADFDVAAVHSPRLVLDDADAARRSRKYPMILVEDFREEHIAADERKSPRSLKRNRLSLDFVLQNYRNLLPSKRSASIILQLYCSVLVRGNLMKHLYFFKKRKHLLSCLLPFLPLIFSNIGENVGQVIRGLCQRPRSVLESKSREELGIWNLELGRVLIRMDRKCRLNESLLERRLWCFAGGSFNRGS